MSYTYELTPYAQRQRKKLETKVEELVDRMLGDLAENPRREGTKKLVDVDPPSHRYSKGDWRIVYSIDDAKKSFLVREIGRTACAPIGPRAVAKRPYEATAELWRIVRGLDGAAPLGCPLDRIS